MGLWDGKPEGNEKAKGAVAFRLPIPHSLDALGRSTSGARRTSAEGHSSVAWPLSLGGWNRCPTPASQYRRRPDVDRCECSSGRVRSLKATVLVLRCLEAPYPSGRALPGTN